MCVCCGILCLLDKILLLVEKHNSSLYHSSLDMNDYATSACCLLNTFFWRCFIQFSECCNSVFKGQKWWKVCTGPVALILNMPSNFIVHFFLKSFYITVVYQLHVNITIIEILFLNSNQSLITDLHIKSKEWVITVCVCVYV